MTTSRNGGEDEVRQLAADLGKALKEGERILAPTRRPDGSLRKAIRIRAGYTPQDEVAIYQSKGALWRKEMEATPLEVPPGYDPAVVESKPKSKSAKRNERKKEKRQQAAHEKGKNLEPRDISPAEDLSNVPENMGSVASKINELSLCENTPVVVPPSNSCSAQEDQVQDIEKKIRALKKKIRLTEAQQQNSKEKDMKPEQLEKVAKLEGWRNELKLLEDKKAELATSLT